MLNYIFMKGRLTSEPELLRVGEEEKAVAKFRLAVPKRKGKGEDEADFFNCVAWNGLAEVIEKFCTKGDSVTIVGSIHNVKWTDKEGNNRYGEQIVVKEIDFSHKKKKDDDSSDDEEVSSKVQNTYDPNAEMGIDNLPF